MSRGQRKTRQLIWVPIIHSPSDLGSVGETFRQLYVRRTSHEDWDRHIQTVDDAWRRIRQAVDRLHLDYGAVRVYQDGLPQCGHELDIVNALAASGSQNHQILLDLAARGATIVGTESPALLLEEYALVQKSLARLTTDDHANDELRMTNCKCRRPTRGSAATQQSLARLTTDDHRHRRPTRGSAATQHQKLSKRVLEKRDRFIVQRVDKTLKAGEVGLIFLGLLHTLERFLPPGIKMTREAWWAADEWRMTNGE